MSAMKGISGMEPPWSAYAERISGYKNAVNIVIKGFNEVLCYAYNKDRARTHHALMYEKRTTQTSFYEKYF